MPPESPPPQLPGSHPTIELGSILHEYQLGLVLIAGASAETPHRPVQWVHASELQDPTPFLTPRTVLLTTGARLSQHAGQEEADAYVARLLQAQVSALGIAVGLHWDRVPPTFVSACDRLGLPLFRVPFDTPFIAIVQTAARLLDARMHARDAWALSSQRAVAGAALHRDGIAAAVAEAAGQLGRWVAITDRTGRLIEFAPKSARADIEADWIRRETRQLVERGGRAGRVRVQGARGVQLQTLGRANHLLGVLVVEGGGAPDHAEQTLIGLVAALATVQLEHRSGLASAEAALRSAVVRLLLGGQEDLAEQVGRGILPRLPRGPVAVIRYLETERTDPALVEDLRSFAAGSAGVLSAALDDRLLLVCESRQLPAARRLFQLYGAPAGISERGTLAGLAELIEQAELALGRALDRPGPAGPVAYTAAMHSGVLRLLEAQPEAAHRAETLLAPLRKHDRRHSDRIEQSLLVWLRHHGQTSPAAVELGVHRHTLRSRVQTAAHLLQRDLDDPDARAELWAAYRLAGGQAPGRGSE
ncbi:PucR family transcriptional regulator [Leucobacter sp. CSA1]|uniref:PucR family transcriptional regulator n=1 Tax=Leucobacter chromiisoli TaxID=2796471 RepID=A0A934QAS2_9MICO|nr:PucR family transcriptional regulator [Leucobacter chromiisoli]MBK0420316.1 PucR family transcriptional regulator [Leucobacter chromiisoli]